MFIVITLMYVFLSDLFIHGKTMILHGKFIREYHHHTGEIHVGSCQNTCNGGSMSVKWTKFLGPLVTHSDPIFPTVNLGAQTHPKKVGPTVDIAHSGW